MNSDSPRYLFLMRHAHHEHGPLTRDGATHVSALAARFAEWVGAEWRDEPGRTIRVWCTSGETEVQETAGLFMRDVSARVRRRSDGVEFYPFEGPGPDRAAGMAWAPALLPQSSEDGDLVRELAAYSPDRKLLEEISSWLEGDGGWAQAARRAEKDAPLLVGNDPLIGWVAGVLTRRPTAVARGELVCLVRASQATRTRWRLLWTISEDAESEAEAIRAKIKSKMDTAKVLGAVIVGLTVFLLQDVLSAGPSLWQWLAFAALGASAGLYFATLFLYDTLQMPPRFWASRLPPVARDSPRRSRALTRLLHGTATVQRPPSSTARVLHAGMIRVWNWIFIPATALAGVGIVLFAIGTVGGGGRTVSVHPWQVVAGTAVVAGVVAGWVAWHRPDLGASD